jgi:hypothetical protein
MNRLLIYPVRQPGLREFRIRLNLNQNHYILYGMYSFVDVHYTYDILYELQFILYVRNLQNLQYFTNLLNLYVTNSG